MKINQIVQETTNVLRSYSQEFFKDSSGATAIEYGLIAALIGVAIIGGVKSISPATNGLWGEMTDKVIAVT